MKIYYELSLTIGTAPNKYTFIKPSIGAEIEVAETGMNVTQDFKAGLEEVRKIVKDSMRLEIEAIKMAFPNATLTEVH